MPSYASKSVRDLVEIIVFSCNAVIERRELDQGIASVQPGLGLSIADERRP
jgi:hypothetical protein